MVVRPRSVAALVLAVWLVGAFACTSEGEPETSGAPPIAPADQPPWGLDGAPLPAGQEDIDAVLAAMPTELDGMIGTVEGSEVGYGPTGMGDVAGNMETFLRVMTVGGADYGTGAPFIEAIVQNGGIQIEAQELDPDAPIVYVAGITLAGEVEYASVMWADPASRFVLLIQGTSPEQRAALVAAYLDAAASALG